MCWRTTAGHVADFTVKSCFLICLLLNYRKGLVCRAVSGHLRLLMLGLIRLMHWQLSGCCLRRCFEAIAVVAATAVVVAGAIGATAVELTRLRLDSAWLACCRRFDFAIVAWCTTDWAVAGRRGQQLRSGDFHQRLFAVDNCCYLNRPFHLPAAWPRLRLLLAAFEAFVDCLVASGWSSVLEPEDSLQEEAFLVSLAA